jgi:hypothetical protein
MFQNRAHWICSAIAVVAAGCGTSHAQLTNCMDPGPRDAFKIFVDEVRVTGGSSGSASVQARLQSIHTFLSENLKHSSGGSGSVRDCGKRHPNDPSDFSSTEFDELDNLRVVLEVWGVVDGPAKKSGSLGFALVPAHSIAPPAVYVIPSANLLNSLTQGRQLSAFAPLVFGISQFQNAKNGDNTKYSSAIPLLCAGTQQLNLVITGQSALGDAVFLSRQQELLKKVRGMTDEAIREARKTPNSPYLQWSPTSDGTFVCPR